MSFQLEGDHSDAVASNLHLLHGTLPREVVCTENLTPFLKLLPCKGKAGIASLLDGHKVFDSSWQSMAIDVRPVCHEGSECVLEIEQSIDMVLDIDRSKRPRGSSLALHYILHLSLTEPQITRYLAQCLAMTSSAIPPRNTTQMTLAFLSSTALARTGPFLKCLANLSRGHAPWLTPRWPLCA